MRQEMSMRLSYWPWIAFSLAALIGACASTPPAPSANVRLGDTLRLCPGVAISNAPAADGARRIANFSPQATINGKKLLRAPVKACLSSGFGPRRGGAGSFHSGLDLYTGRPETIVAGGDGVVETVGPLRAYGKTVLINHGRGVKTRYAHLSEYASGLKPGQRVAMGEPIGRTGATGNATAVHLHYEIIVNGKRQNPLTAGR